MNQIKTTSQMSQIFRHAAENPRYRAIQKRTLSVSDVEIKIGSVEINSDTSISTPLERATIQASELLAGLAGETLPIPDPAAYAYELLTAQVNRLHHSNPEELRFWRNENERQSATLINCLAENHALTEQLIRLQGASIGDLFTQVADELEEGKNLCVDYLDSIETRLERKGALGVNETKKLLGTVRAVMDCLEDYICQARNYVIQA